MSLINTLDLEMELTQLPQDIIIETAEEILKAMIIWQFPQGGVCALMYKSDGGVPTDASNQGSIGDNFLAKKGVIG